MVLPGLRIALVAPPWFEVPPRAYGGVEAVVADLAKGLVDRGHDVLVIGAGERRTVADFGRTYERPPSERLGETLPELVHTAAAARMLDALDVDVVHDHSLAGPLTAGSHRAPVVATFHHPADSEYARYYDLLTGRAAIVAVSESQRRLAPGLPWTGTVHNGIDVDSFAFQPTKSDAVLFLGRLSPLKGVHIAIDAARATGRPIVVAGAANDAVGRDYLAAELRPRAGADVRLVGEVDAVAKRRLLARARCLVFPPMWEEPFGLVMVEAMACGTPVAALRRGSVPEIVVDGLTGSLADDPDGLPAAIEAAGSLRPEDCRAHVARNFDLALMAGRYEDLYRDVVGVGTGRNSRRRRLPAVW